MMNPPPTMILALKNVRALSEEELTSVLVWVDSIPISREKRNLTRDFSDAVTVAEILKHYMPRNVELTQYPPSNGTNSKEANWYHLNRKVLHRVGLELNHDVIHALAQCRPWVVENLLVILRERLENSSFVEDITLTTGPAGSYRALQVLPHGSASSGSPYFVTTDRPGNGHAGISTFHGNGMKTNRASQNFFERSSDAPPIKRSQAIQKSIEDQQKREIEEQNRTIEALTANLYKLEHTIRLKDIRIEDLSGRLELAEISAAQAAQANGSGRGAVAGGGANKIKVAPTSSQYLASTSPRRGTKPAVGGNKNKSYVQYGHVPAFTKS